MKPTRVRKIHLGSRACLALLPMLTALAACESDSVFEGPPTVAPPVAAFDEQATAKTAIHGGVLAVAVTAEDPYVGVDSVIVRYSGPVLEGSFVRRYSGAPKQVRVDTALPIPFGKQGTVLLETYALNRYGSMGRIDSLTVNVVRLDTIRPTVTMQSAVLPQRAELTGTMSFTVAAQDDAFGGGLSQVGVAVRVGTTLVAESLPASGTARVTKEIVLPVSRLTSTAPSLLSVEYYAWAVDQAGNCTASGAAGVSLPCTYANGALTIPALAGTSASLQVTATHSLGVVQSWNMVGDLVIDAARRQLYISNQGNNSIETVSWSGTTLSRVPATTLVGARPMGMTIDRSGDTLIVANSGGTSLSYVALANLQEQHRYETTNSVLYELSDDELKHREYADRPEYVAQDRYGLTFYSTLPTAAAPQGTIQTVEWDPAWQQRENDMMLWSHIAVENGWGPGIPPLPCWSDTVDHIQPCIWAFADSVKIDYENPLLGTQVEVFDHVPGFPERRIHISSRSLREIDDTLRSQGSDVLMFRGKWFDTNLGFWSSGDTTLVAAAGDGSSVAFAEADEAPGQVWGWNALAAHPRTYERLISDMVNIDDLVNNTAAPMQSLALNYAGTLICTRSTEAAFFFTNPLRLRGTYFGSDIAGGKGFGLHPDASFEGGVPATNWAAAGTAAPEIILIDTRNFRRVGSIPLLEPVGGPIRVIRALAGDAPNIVAHLFGVTRSGSVFYVPVRSSDINP